VLPTVSNTLLNMQISTQTFPNISLMGRSSQTYGTLKFADKGFAWRAGSGNKSVSCIAKDVVSAKWICLGRKYQLKVLVKGGAVHRFDGFRKKDMDDLKPFFKAYNKSFELEEHCTKGWNFGEVDIDGKNFIFSVNGLSAFELELGELSQCYNHKKNEIALEFQRPDKAVGQELVEVRFYIPPDLTESSSDKAVELREEVLSVADVNPAEGGSVIAFNSIPILTPRGRYEMEFYATFVRLHGKTFDYKISYKNIDGLYCFPKPDNRHIIFVVSCTVPVRQGNTIYPHLVIQIPAEDRVELDVNLEKLGKKKEQTKLKEQLSGKTYKVFRLALKELVAKKIHTVGKFVSNEETSCIKCSQKTNDGFLYPLKRCFFFIHKPTSYIPYSAISLCSFARLGNSTSTNRTFDLEVKLKDGSDYQFTSIQRNEFQNLYNFLVERKIPVDQSTLETQPVNYAEDDMVESESDDDFAPQEVEEVEEEYVVSADAELGDIDDFLKGGYVDEEEEEYSSSEEEEKSKSSKRKREQEGSPSKEKKEKPKKRRKKEKKEEVVPSD